MLNELSDPPQMPTKPLYLSSGGMNYPEPKSAGSYEQDLKALGPQNRWNSSRKAADGTEIAYIFLFSLCGRVILCLTSRQMQSFVFQGRAHPSPSIGLLSCTPDYVPLCFPSNPGAKKMNESRGIFFSTSQQALKSMCKEGIL